MNERDKEHRLPPYVSYRTWNTFLEKVKGQIPLPPRMDSSVWSRLPFSGSNQSQLKGALLYLGLLDSEDHPDPMLEQLAHAEDAERQKLLTSIFERSYRELLNQIDLERASPGQIREYFKSVGAEGQIGQKCATFFLSLAKEVGRKLHVSLQARAISAKGRVIARRRKTRASTDQEDTSLQSTSTVGEMNYLTRMDPSMIGLLQKLPQKRLSWPNEERESWKKAFDALFDFLYPPEKK